METLLLKTNCFLKSQMFLKRLTFLSVNRSQTSLRSLTSIIAISFISATLFSQTIDDIKSKSAIYLWGQGSATTIEKADAEALYNLIGQISTTVSSEFTMHTEGMKTDVKSLLKTYSKATLHNTERMIIQNEPDAVVFRYVKRDDVKKDFAERKNKIIEFVESAKRAESENRIAEALKYNYWALALLTSHPDFNSITGADNALLSVSIPEQINRNLENVKISIQKVEKEASQ